MIMDLFGIEFNVFLFLQMAWHALEWSMSMWVLTAIATPSAASPLQTSNEIPQIQLYVELVRKLNNTNYMELRRAYRREVDVDPETELVDSLILNSSMSHDHGPTISRDSGVAYLQMSHNDTVITFTQIPGIPVPKSHENITREMEMVLETSVQTIGEDISMTEVEYNSSRPQLPESDELSTKISRNAWMRYKCNRYDCNENEK
ncbi:cysteine motif protein 7 [Diadegma fenestrale ichnovirus]|nr:cysteine motif protein 7 [Diadegma fenestrale ichnovirus]